MRSPIAAAAVGALAGVSVAATVRLADAYLRYLPRPGFRTLSLPPSPIDFLLSTGCAAGPGAFVLGYVLALLLRTRSERGAARGRVLALGALGGLPAGMLNLLALMLLLGRASEIPTLLSDSQGRMIGISALAGGLALGIACAWWLTRPSKEPA